MLKYIKHFIKVSFLSVVKIIGRAKVGRCLFEQLVDSIPLATQSTCYKDTTLIFCSPNQLNRFRIDTFSVKEPETLEWIDAIPMNSVVWDIGANIGLYSCYAAKSRGCRVYAFEPSVFNLELLARNIYLNSLAENIAILPFPLTDRLGFNTLNMSNTEQGGALSTFGHNFGWDGNQIQQVFQFRTLGISADDALWLLGLPQPSYIKVDVDGIEHLILGGAKNVLSKVDGVLIEINDTFADQLNQSNKLLHDAGLVLKEKRHGEIFDDPESFGKGRVFNQIWTRSGML